MQCNECQGFIPEDSDQIANAELAASNATYLGGMPYDVEANLVCDNCEASYEGETN
jgi:hypothetical protein